ncbi:MAG: protein-glutamate O-methyltransferase CheR [Myxococcaceae bacterium]|nr:protein-glutamate O-methyltransferase CheR [Myxococcaceae bacterium]
MSVSQADAQFVREVVERRSAIHLDACKDYLIETRLERLATDRGFGTVAALVQQARQLGQGALHVQIVEAITTHETLFFRDVHPFEALRATILPALIEARRQRRELTLWSAACSSGQEAYSLAMLVLEHFPEVQGWPVRILATDLSAAVLEQAKRARFTQLEVNRGLPAALLVKYFRRQGAHWTPSDAVRRLVEFRQLNLIDDTWALPASPDVVMLRNVLIYFETEAKQRILERVRQVMAADGSLLLGSAETVFGLSPGWTQKHANRAVYYQVLR